MFDLVKCLLRFSFYQARLMGLINFDIDLSTGKARITRRTTIFIALINMITIGSVPWLMNSQVIHGFWEKSGGVFEYLFLLVFLGCIACVIITVITRWWQRRVFVRLVNVLQRLAKEKPQVKSLMRRGIISKIVSVSLQTICQLIFGVLIVNDKISLERFFGSIFVSAIIIQAVIILGQYYLALLNIHGHYRLLNEELRQLLIETRSLETEERKGVFMIKCCSLADQLDVIAGSQYLLQKLVNQISKLFELPILFVLLSSYMTSVGVIYFIFSELNASTITSAFSIIGFLVIALEYGLYFTDQSLVLGVVYAVADAHEVMKDLLSQHAEIAHVLDVRLEIAFERFKLQLAWNTLKFSVLGLYFLQKSNIAAMWNSTISNSLVLIQYDLQHLTH